MSRLNPNCYLQVESLKDSLQTAERAVIQNVYQQKQALYRNETVLKGIESCLVGRLRACLPVTARSSVD